MKRLLQLGIFFLLLSHSPSYAVPAAPDLFDVIQPDGTSFKAGIHGDEFQSWTEASESGHTIMKNHDTGYWEYADQNADGALMPSGQRVDPTGRMAPRLIQKGIRPPRDTGMEKLHQEGLKQIFQERLAPSSSVGIDLSQTNELPAGVAAVAAGSGWAPQPVSGTRKILVVLVSFADRAIQTTATSWHDTVFSTIPGVKSVANYYSDHSFGKLIISPLAHSQPGNPVGVVSVTLSQNHPNPPASDKYQGESTWVPVAINAVDQYVNFKSLDSNNNGLIDRSELIVYFIVAGYEMSSTAHTPATYAHAHSYSSGGLSVAGVKFPVYAMNGELNDPGRQMPMGVIAHELGHQICGLPDLYDTAKINTGLGNFSVMAGGSWGKSSGEDQGTTPVSQDAWSREYVGWSSPQTPVSNLALSLGTPLAAAGNSLKLVNSTVSIMEYWLVDNRFPTGWDKGIAGLIPSYGGGLLITHVDLTPRTEGSTGDIGFNVYSVDSHQGLVIEQASTSGCDMVASGSKCRGSALTTYYTSNNDSFALATTPNSNYYSGVPSGFQVNNISARGAIMSANVVTPAITVTPPVVTAFVLNSSQPATTLYVPITTLTARGAGMVNGYWVSESNVSPAAGAAGWTSAPQPTYTFTTPGSKTLYAFARDSIGNVSGAKNATVVITLSDVAPPTVDTFTLPVFSSSAIVPITSLTASDNIGVTGYCISEIDSSAGCTWSGTAPGNMTVSGIIPGKATARTIYAFARDGVGNVSASRPATVTISIADSVAPTVTAFSLPASSSSAAVNITGFTAIDNVGVTGYCVTEGSSAAGCAWSDTPQTGYIFTGISAGVPTARVLNAFARDAVGNVSSGLSATATITIPLNSAGANIIQNPGFEAGNTGWTYSSSGNYEIIFNDPGQGNNGTNWYGWLGGDNNLTEYIYQDIAISANATAVNLSFFYNISTDETSTTQELDTMKVEVVDPANGTTLLALRTLSNLDATAGWTRSQDFDLLQFKGRTVRVKFSDATNAANLTGFKIDDVSLLVTIPGVDSSPPQISTFTIPAVSSAMTVAVTFNVTDNVGVASYCLIENSSSDGCFWSGTKPTNYTFAGTLIRGIPAVKTLYAFVKDAAGNISVGRNATVTITIPVAGGTTNLIQNPGFESGAVSWVSYCSSGYDLTSNGAGLGNNGSDWYAWLGGDISLTDYFYQDVTIPANAAAANLNFYYSIGTDEDPTGQYDTMTVEVVNPVTGVSKAVLHTYSNLDATSGWAQSQIFNLLAYKGTTVRIKFSSVNDYSYITSFFIDDINLDVVTSGGDGILPQISSFSLAPVSLSLTVPITSFTVTDNVGVTGYCLNESGNASLCTANWQATVPQNYTFETITPGIPTVKTLYAFVKDGAGNVSTVRNATVTINIPDAGGGTNIIQNPGFEDGTAGWTSYSSGGWSLISNDSGLAVKGNNSSDWFAWLGGDNNLNEFLYQDLVIPANASGAVFNFFYEIITVESPDSAYDVMTIEVVDPDTGATLKLLRTFSNLDAGATGSSGWVKSQNFDLSAYIGKKVRFRFADATNSNSKYTSFYLDDVRLLVNLPPSKQVLSVAINGTGTGSVNSNPAGIACSTGAVGACSAQFDSGSQTTLYPSPAAGSFFSGWANDCTNPSGTCMVTMSAARGVTGTFNYYPARTVNGQTPYSSLQAAFNGSAANDTILVQGATLQENIIINRAIIVTLKGGYDTHFIDSSGSTLIQGTVTLRTGTIILDDFTIR